MFRHIRCTLQRLRPPDRGSLKLSGQDTALPTSRPALTPGAIFESYYGYYRGLTEIVLILDLRQRLLTFIAETNSRNYDSTS